MLERWNVQISTGGVVDGGMSRVFSIEFLRYMSIRAEAILLYLVALLAVAGRVFSWDASLAAAYVPLF